MPTQHGPLQCDWCDKTFKVRSELTKHVETMDRVDARKDPNSTSRCGRRCVKKVKASVKKHVECAPPEESDPAGATEGC
jgi:hypothetical protein